MWQWSQTADSLELEAGVTTDLVKWWKSSQAGLADGGTTHKFVKKESKLYTHIFIVCNQVHF